MKELRDYYDNSSLTREIMEAELNTDVDESPMIGITVRFPKPVLDRVRELAAREGVKTTALVRRWVEEKVSAALESSESAATTTTFTISVTSGMASKAAAAIGGAEASKSIAAARRAPLARAS